MRRFKARGAIAARVRKRERDIKITLEGTVDSRQTKNAIEEIAEQFGNQDVQNNLRIQRAGQQSSETTGRQSKGTSGDDNTATKQKHN